MNSKLSRTLVLLAVLALFAVTFSTVRPTEGRYTSDFAVSVGECGYYQNQGTLHRNGLVTPDHCSIPADGIAVMVYEKYIPVMVESAAIDPVDTESTDEWESDDKPVVTVPDEKKDKPVVSSPDKKEKKDKHCNNGNGNGPEGCNASDKGNNDETEEKGDKGESHPEHGNGHNNH